METAAERECRALKPLLEKEELAGKKASIYAKLLTEQSVAQTMEEIMGRHIKRREKLIVITGGKVQKEGGRYEVNANGDEA